MTRWFAMRMAPVAVLAGLAVWMGPPLVEVWTARRAGLAAAEDQAGRLAHALSELAARQPRLWRYNAAKVVHAASAWADRPDVAGVTITDCGGEVWFSPERLGVGTGRPGGLTGWAAVASPRGTVAWVGVRRDDSGAAAARSMLHGASGILGLLVGLVLFLFPTAVVRRQATRLEEGRAVLRGQEEERGRVARDLHDGLGQELTALRMAVEGGRTDEALAASDEAMAELRRVVADLRPPDLEEGGLVEALRACTERFERRSGLPVSFRGPDGLEVSQDVGATLLRCLQEGLGNAARHAEATEIGVRLTVQGGHVALAIVDDGKGVTPAVALSGLRTVRERCDFLDGQVHVGEAEGGGTSVRIQLPLA